MFDILGFENGALPNIRFEQIADVELREYSSPRCPDDSRWLEVPTRLSVMDPAGEWSFAGEGPIRFNPREELQGSFDVVEIDLGGDLELAADGEGASLGDWQTSTNQGFDPPPAFFVLSLILGDQNLPGSRMIVSMEIELE